MTAGDVAARLYANDEATTHYTQAMELVKQGDWSTEQLVALYLARGRRQEIQGRCDEALARYLELEQLGRESSNAALELAALIARVTVYSTITGKPDLESGRVLSERSLSLARQLEDHRSEARILWNNMLIEIFAGDDFYQALEFGEQSLRIARQYGLEEQIAYTLQDTARAHLVVEQFAEAREAYEGARGLWRSFDDRPMLADNLINSSGLFYLQGDFKMAIDLAEEALAISHSIGSDYLEAVSLTTIAQAHVELGDIGRALEAIEEGTGKLEGLARASDMSALLHGTTAVVFGLHGMPARALTVDRRRCGTGF